MSSDLQYRNTLCDLAQEETIVSTFGAIVIRSLRNFNFNANI